MMNEQEEYTLEEYTGESPDQNDVKEQMRVMQAKIERLETEAKEKEDSFFDDSDDFSWLGKLILIGIVAVLLWIFCPSNAKMEADISRDILTEQLQDVASIFNLDQYVSIDVDHLDDNEVVEKCEKYGRISIKNYGLIKLGYFKAKGKKKEHLRGIGICGIVLMRSMIPSNRRR